MYGWVDHRIHHAKRGRRPSPIRPLGANRAELRTGKSSFVVRRAISAPHGGAASQLTVEEVHASIALTTWSTSQLQARDGLGWDGPTWERWCVRFLTDALLGGGEVAVLDGA